MVNHDVCVEDFIREKRTAKELYEVLLTLADRKMFDDDFSRGLMVLGEIAVDKSLVYYLRARMNYAMKHYEEALEDMEKALSFRAIDFVYWELMAKIQEKLGDNANRYYYLALLWGNDGTGRSFQLPLDEYSCMKAIGQAMINPGMAPFCKKFFIENNELNGAFGNVAGEYLYYDDQGDYRDFCGVFNSRGWLNMHSDMALCFDKLHHAPHIYCDMSFDVMKAERRMNLQVDAPDTGCIIAIAPEEAGQSIVFSDGGQSRQATGGRWEFSFYRLVGGKTTIQSDRPFQVTRPLQLGHSSHRKKLVLNILADGLSWRMLKQRGYKTVPHIMKFFSKGVIFDNNYSVAEHTYPSLPTIETGCYTYHTQIFNDKVQTRLSRKMPVISEQMHALGYYCVNLLSDASGIYNGTQRGFDRNIIQQFTSLSYEAVNRCIEHLDAFREVDNYVYLHISDAHPFNSYVQVASHTQTSLPWQERILEEYDNSVFKRKNKLNMSDNQYSIGHMDRQLGMLFGYIEEHYDEDEYLVNLYSDHGVSVYDEESYLLSENQSGAALMLRGDGVPSLGLVNELTSAVDLYPLMDKLLGFPLSYDIDGRLPVTFGGQGRKYTVSMSIYPGQTFKLCLRDIDYEFRLETEALTRISGQVNMNAYNVHIYRRDTRQEVFDDGIRARFMLEALEHIKSFAVFDEEE